VTVLLASGFGCPPFTLSRLAAHLRTDGRDVSVAPLGFNVGCGEATVTRLADELERAAHPVTLVGHSRGGQLARVLAVRHPEIVDRLVTVATPWSIGPPRQRGIETTTSAIRFLRRHGMKSFASIECATGDCCVRFRADLESKPAARWVAVWSPTDKVAGGDTRPPATADVVVETHESHMGVVRSSRGIAAITEALSR